METKRTKTNRVTPITQHDIDRVIEMLESTSKVYERYSQKDADVEECITRMVTELESAREPQTLHLAHTVMLDVIAWGLTELGIFIPMLTERIEEDRERKKQTIQLKADVERLRQMVWQPQGAVTLPEQTIRVHSQIQTVILRLMAQEGLARSWRIQQHVIGMGLTQNKSSVRNGLRQLSEKGLVSDYWWNGHKVGWSPVPGGRRRLVMLTEKGRAWCQKTLDEEPAESEIAPMAKAHNSVAHAVGILEARDHLRAHGYQVDDSPDPILAEEGERWGRRAEPDLTVEMNGHTWPVEVQRDVSPRYTTKKWAKVLKLTGRLMLILFSDEKRSQQEAILTEASKDLAAGDIRLISLETMEGDLWEWASITTSGDG
ncbi:MAG: hypothetical protein GY832_35510 [Chloroflexi bacterium]|nr:hypothetical protein [Chloroflexota bacterium]